MFDTHCHLYLDPLFKNISEIINKSRDSKVKYFLVPGVDLKTSKKAIEISLEFENVFASVGIHPTIEVEKENIVSLVYKIEEIINSDRVVAVGEIGMDYYHKVNPERIQKNLFEKQLDLAIRYNKPVIIHSRHSSEDIISSLKNKGLKNFSKSLVFHCAEPENEILEVSKKYNFFIGVDGDVTFDIKKQNFVRKVPLENMVLETDSPYLSPTSNGKKDKSIINYPYNLPLIAERVSKIKNISVENIVQITTENALMLFGV